MTNKLIYILLLFLSISAISCRRYENDMMLESVLTLAGPNRIELEKVIEHYANDSLKLKAAIFLIKNMPGHYSYVDTAAITRYAHAVDSIVNSMKGETDYNIIRDAIDSTASKMGMDTLKVVQDCQIIKADYLISNIETAFYDWQQGSWAKHICFDDFCEWILPYKEGELQPLDNWRSRLKTFHSERLNELNYCDQLRNSPLAAAKLLNDNLADSLNPAIGLAVRHAHIPVEHRAHIPFGQCNDYALMATTILRSHGIPVATDFTPQWARRNMGHTWNVLFSDDGRKIPFGGICARLGDLHKYEEKMSKVYRLTYSPNKNLVELNNCHEYVPSVFRNVFMRDVTRETIQCCDVTLKVGTTEDKYAYLHVFDNHEWVPVAFGKIKRGKVIFKDIGQNIMYLAATYPNDIMNPISTPFILEYSGKVTDIIPDKERTQDMILDRKYPVMEYAYEFIPRLRDGEFHASNDAHFRKYYLVHKIMEGKASGQCFAVPDSIPPCRYWRYINNRKSTFCSIAEVMFYTKGDTARLKGKVIGIDGSWGDNPNHKKETVFDGDVLTSFDAPRGEGCWVGLDFGKPYKVDYVIYYPRGDGNSIEIGDEYELFYWDDHWISLGRQKAGNLYLKYNNAPSGALYLLKNHTKGIDERIFTYEGKKQIWW